MKCYLIQETLTECSIEDIKKREYQYCAIVTPDEYRSLTDVFHMGIDIEMDLKQIRETKAVVNYDSLTGTFNIPDHDNYSGQKKQLAFALDERGIVFVDEDDYAESVIRNIQASKKWKLPSLERLLYDFLEETIKNDMSLLEMLEENLSGIENGIMCGDIEEYPIQLNDIRYELLDLQKHYEHLIDLSQELEENENEFFYEDNLRYFKLFTERVNRLQDTVIQLREFIVQLRDLVSEQLSIRQNKIVTLLTVITTIFMPLTLIVGWYGMNFIYMPELRSPYGYPGVIFVSVLIVVILLYWFKKKRWM
ncbi:MAG: CorA family divalent cation transporter [Erysipelotrichaceae bacterium]|nr:CorA family divalent cation transporter [Erysipelotrichaceae bacterium]